MARAALGVMALALTLALVAPRAPWPEPPGRPPAVGATRVGTRLCLSLRGGGRRRKDWQSPRPGDSDEVLAGSQSEDPDWSAEHDGTPNVRRAMFADGGSSSEEISVPESSDFGRRKRYARQPQRQGRATRNTRLPGRRPGGQSIRGGGRAPGGRGRHSARHNDPSEDEGTSGTDLDLYSLDYERPRRGPRAIAAGERWGTQATDALEAALRGKPLPRAVQRPHNKARPSKHAAPPRRSRPPAERSHDESSDFQLHDSTSSSGKIRRIDTLRLAPGLERLHDSWIDDRYKDAEAPAACAASAARVQQPSYRQGYATSHKGGPGGGLQAKTDQPVSSGEGLQAKTHQPVSSWQESDLRTSPGLVSAASPSAAEGEERRHTSLELNEHSAQHGDSHEGSAVERDAEVAEYAGAEATEDAMRAIAERLHDKGAALFMSDNDAHTWHGSTLGAPCGAADDGIRHVITPAAAPSPSLRSTRDASGNQDVGSKEVVSPSVAPVSTSVALQGLGAAMSSAAEAVAVVGERKDLESHGLSINLMSLAQRLDDARQQGEAASKLLQAPDCIAYWDVGETLGSCTEGLVHQVEDNLRHWRRRAIVSGVWQGMRREAEASIAARERQGGPTVYVGGCYGTSSEDLIKAMSLWGRVVGVHKADAYGFVEFAEESMAAAAVRASRQLRAVVSSGTSTDADASGKVDRPGSGSDRMLVLAAPHGCIRRGGITLRAPRESV